MPHRGTFGDVDRNVNILGLCIRFIPLRCTLGLVQCKGCDVYLITLNSIKVAPNIGTDALKDKDTFVEDVLVPVDKKATDKAISWFL